MKIREVKTKRKGEQISPPHRRAKRGNYDSLTDRRDGRRPAKIMKFLEVGLYLFFGVESVVVVPSQIVKRLLESEHVIDGNQHGMRHRNGSSVLPSTNSQPIILRSKEGVLVLYR